MLGIRPDGYHELRTTFQSLALHDTLTFTAGAGPFAHRRATIPRCPTDATNLVWRAAERLWRAAGRRGDAARRRVRIAKRIPMQAGLGGGSSDAAAALRALTRSGACACRADELRGSHRRSIGADVPFFLEGGTVLGVERGDVLFPLQDSPPAWVVLASPDFGVSTQDAYGWWDRSRSAQAAGTPGAVDAGASGERSAGAGRAPASGHRDARRAA